MAPKVYTMHISQPARALAWACACEGTEVDEVTIMPGKDTRSAEYRQRGPITAVPRLEEDGFVLNESHAIMCYLGDRHGWKLYPSDPQVRARVHQYMNWHHQNTRRITLALFAPVMRPDIPLPKETIDLWKKEISSPQGTLNSIEQWLSASKWLCGDMPTLADLSCYCEVGQCLDKYTGLFGIHGIDLAPYPRLNAWLAECERLPGYEKSHAMLKDLAPKIKAKAGKASAKL
uniref:Glutathione transferase n=1 Tax=Zooxanthella nutricula TaxID=1333877 RepID=A0A6U8UKD7_9DINO|mmetsp:Transcript_103774/g.317793  ORF Transcript_103774/g.317793 Transcript_103774/m.317793 type:complete len:232 (+) Transcript_103774:68-763(+)|eukprot:CAMPEP_0198529172 /NCGR_PEP_ID=MMETSP1462-20131121/25591_1 /TAXON_ID=1333877 /ORGANISM="Brandtodinium nutriculum, Strain RCC3387" /LENGTH=231 /DNA_ID=CAMNT_0044259013 /DNA_START=70 /DNA_END=765 /DNA_ORIENTATION=+